MHNDSSEPSEGAAQVVSRGVSTAEKRAEYARLGLEWPKYPDGTDQLWHKDRKSTAGGRFTSWLSVQTRRRYDIRKQRLLNGVSLSAPIKTKCRWTSWDDAGYPSCIHGRARKDGPQWKCNMKVKQAIERTMADPNRRMHEMSQRARRARLNKIEKIELLLQEKGL